MLKFWTNFTPRLSAIGIKCTLLPISVLSVCQKLMTGSDPPLPSVFCQRDLLHPGQNCTLMQQVSKIPHSDHTQMRKGRETRNLDRSTGGMIRDTRQLLRWKDTELPEGADPICPHPSQVLNPLIPWETKERQGVMAEREARGKDQIIREGGEGSQQGWYSRSS